MKQAKITVLYSSLDKKIEHSWKDVINPANMFFGLISRITDKAIRENHLDDTAYKSNGFLSYGTQLPTFAVSEVKRVYASMPITLNAPAVRELICKQIQEKNKGFR